MADIRGTTTTVSLRPGRPADAKECGRVCYEAFGAISGQHNFPSDFPSVDVATDLMTMLLSHPRFFSVVAVEHGAIELPRAVFVGVRQGRARGRRDAQVLELALAAAQPAANLPQRMGAPELAEQHRHELPPAREAPRVTLGVRPLHQGLELRPRKQLEQLAEHAGESAHG